MSQLHNPWPIRSGRNGWLAAAGAAVLLLVAVSFLDATLSRTGQGLPEPIVTIFRWVTRLGDSEFVLVPSLLIALIGAGAAAIVQRERLKEGWRQLAGLGAFVFIAVGVPSLFTALVKRLIGRPRPTHLETVGPFDLQTFSWLDWTYQSFPSGHSTTAFSLCFAVSFLFPRTFPAMLGLAIVIGVSRIVVGAHYPTDIIGGAIVGTLGAYLVRSFFVSRGWVFERRADGAIAAKPMGALGELTGR